MNATADFDTLLSCQAVLEAMKILSHPYEGLTGSAAPYPREARSLASLLLAATATVAVDSSEASRASAFLAVSSAASLVTLSTPATADQVSAWYATLKQIASQVLKDGVQVRDARMTADEAIASLATASLIASKERSGVRVPVDGYRHDAVPTLAGAK